jgi:hypothetical protein
MNRKKEKKWSKQKERNCIKESAEVRASEKFFLLRQLSCSAWDPFNKIQKQLYFFRRQLACSAWGPFNERQTQLYFAGRPIHMQRTRSLWPGSTRRLPQDVQRRNGSDESAPVFAQQAFNLSAGQRGPAKRPTVLHSSPSHIPFVSTVSILG